MMRQNLKRKLLAGLLTACMILQTVGIVPVYAVENGADSGVPVGTSSVCEHHSSHDDTCGYKEEEPCTHTHTADCYTDELICGFPAEAEDSGTDSDATHTHTQECYKLNCPHENGEHDDTCGYVEGTPCTFDPAACEICKANKEEIPQDCTCEIPCTEDKINADCPICSAENADLTKCTGKEPQQTCTCETPCTEDKKNADCPVCGAENADLTKCIGEENAVQKVQALIDALPTLEALKAITDKDEQNAIYTKLQTAYEAYIALTKEEQVEVVGAEIFEPMFAYFNSMTETLVEDIVSVKIGSTTTNYTDFSEAWAAATQADNSEIILLADITTGVQFTIPENKTMTIDLNGKLWTDTNTTADTSTVEANGDLTINDSQGNGGITANSTVSHRIFYIGESESAKLTINDGNFEVADGQSEDGEVVYSWGKLYINGGTFKANDSNENVVTIRYAAHCYFKITGGNFTNGILRIGSEYTKYYSEGGKGEITGGSFAHIKLYWNESINIRGILPAGVNFFDTTGNQITDDAVLNSKSIENVTVKKGALVISENPTMDSVLEYQRYSNKKLSVTAEKSDPSATGDISYQWYQKIGEAEAVAVTDATQAEYPLPDNLEKNTYSYYCEVSFDGNTLTSSSVTFEVKELQQVAGVTASDGTYTTYSSMQAALDAAPNNSTIKLLVDIITYSEFKINNKTITIDVDGQCFSADRNNLFTAEHSDITLTDTSSTNDGYVTGYDFRTKMIDADDNSTIHFNDICVNAGNINAKNIIINKAKLGNVTFMQQTLNDVLAEGSSLWSLTDNTWVSPETMKGNTINNAEVRKIPIKITAQPQDKTIYYGYTNETLSLAATAVDSSKAITYQWYSVGTGSEGADQVITDVTTNTLPIPQGKALGDYQYYCKLTCDGYTLQSSIATVTISQSGTTFDGGIKTYKDSTETTTFTYGDTITVKVTPKATGMAPKTRTFAAPTANQMALFIGETQIAAPQNATSGTELTFIIDTSGKALVAGSNTITAKYKGNENMATFEGTVTVTLNENPNPPAMLGRME